MTTTMTIAQRLDHLVGIVEASGFINIKDLARHCQVAEITVRRDAKALAEKGRVRLEHGGVAAVGRAAPRSGGGGQESVGNIDRKRGIAAFAASLIQPHDTLFLDSGTTVQELARMLPRDFPLTVVCCSLDAFEACRDRDNCEIILVGGMFSPDSTLFYGPESVEMLKKFRTHRAFFGATGCDSKLGVTCRYINDVQHKQVALATSIDPVLLVDSDKFGRVGSHFFSEPSVFSAIVTDPWLTPDRRQEFTDAGCNVIIAET